MVVYHGSPNQDIIPTFGLGEEKHYRKHRTCERVGGMCSE